LPGIPSTRQLTWCSERSANFFGKELILSSNLKNITVFVVVTAVVASLMYAIALDEGTDGTALHTMLRASGRLSTLIFLLVFITRPLHQLIAKPWSRRLLQNRRSIGISFAAAHSVHLSLILWLWQSVPDEVFSMVTIVIGGGGFVLMYLMLITSFDAAAKALGPKAWRRLHKTGLYWIGFIFAYDFFDLPIATILSPQYLPYSIAILLAVAIRLAAWKNQH
jgi:DMSO/TMAO reductase YedYZ heme-binding membrane subunit